MSKLTKIATEMDGLFLIEHENFFDERGLFFEFFNEADFFQIDIKNKFVQDNVSVSKKGVIRGMHFQKDGYAQSKLIKVVKGKILDVVVDMRKNSKTFGKYFKVELSSDKNIMLFIPRGFAHGFLSLENDTTILYKNDNFYSKENEDGILWNDTFVNIDWNLKRYGIEHLIISEKDKNYRKFEEVVK